MNGIVFKFAAIVVLAIGGLYGAGMIYDHHFGGQQRELNIEQDRQLKRHDEVNQDQYQKLAAQSTEIAATQRHNREQDAELNAHAERLTVVEGRTEVLQQQADALEAEIITIRSDLAKSNERAGAQAEQLSRLEMRLSELRQELAEEREMRAESERRTEERLKRIERLMGLGEPRQ